MAIARRRVPWRLLTLLTILVIVLATTWPWTDFRGHPHWDKVEWLPIRHDMVVRDLWLNLLLFVPAGYCVRRAWPRLSPGHVLLAAIALSLAVESYQLFSHRRFPTVADVLTNGLGAWIGARLAGGASDGLSA